MRDCGACLVAALQLGLGEPDAMAVDCAPPEQAVMIVDVEVALALRKQLPDPLYLLPVLGNMRLQETIGMLGLERAGSFELRRGACRGKAGRDRVH